MITLDQSDALSAHLATTYKATILRPGDFVVQLMGALARYGLAVIPGARETAAVFALQSKTVSRTVPTPFGTFIMLSEAAVSSPAQLAETVSHEACHAHQIVALGGAAEAEDYLGSGELRATREAHAYVVGLWVRYLVTGVVPTELDAMVSLGGGLYHLAPEEVELARGIVRSGLASIAKGQCPPYEVAAVVLDWFMANAPSAIVGRVAS